MRIAVVGYGYWGPNVVRSLCELAGPSQVVVLDSRRESMVRARKEHPGIDSAAGWRSLLADESVGALYLATPAGTHFSLAGEALAAGKHLLIEKPFATSSSEAASLFAEAARRRRVVMAGHLYLYSAALRALKELIDGGELGDLRYLYSRRTSLGPRAREDVSVVWDYLAHDAYIMPYLTGGAPREVSAHGEAFLRPGTADVVFATMRFPGAVLAACQASWYDPLKVRHLCVVGSRRMAVYDDADHVAPLVVYDRGYEQADGADPFGNQGLRRFDDGSRAVPVGGEQPLLAQCRAFLEAIALGRMPAAEAACVIATTSTLEAAERSLNAGGTPMTVEEVAVAA